MKKYLLLILASLQTTTLLAGWSSGGGELHRDENNPWFLQNTKQVNYCIQIDEENFGIKKEEASELIQTAISFWKNQLSYLSERQMNLKLGTQTFIESNCNQYTEITFQFGILNQEQKMKISDLSRTVGIAVRTEYDRVNLKAKGFIYIAPEKGQLKPQFDNNIKNIWSIENGLYLLPVLIHEIGHTFGIRHNSNINIMSEDFVDQFFMTWFSPEVGQDLYKEQLDFWNKFKSNVLNNKLKLFKINMNDYNYNYSMCEMSSQPIPVPNAKLIKANKIKTSSLFDIFDFFEVSNSSANSKRCLNIYYQNSKLNVLIKYNSANYQLAGIIDLNNLKGEISIETAVKLWLPTEQKVITKGNSMTLFFEMEESQSFQTEYISVDKKIKRIVNLELRPNNNLRLDGVYQNKIYTDILN